MEKLRRVYLPEIMKRGDGNLEGYKYTEKFVFFSKLYSLCIIESGEGNTHDRVINAYLERTSNIFHSTDTSWYKFKKWKI